jgi:hypothetical protein
LRAIVCVVAALFVAAAMFVRPQSLPGPQVAGRAPVEPRQCAECHQRQFDDFQTAPHARTLRRLEGSEVASQFDGRTLKDRATGAELTWRREGNALLASIVGRQRSLELQWAFGSGQHAITPVAVWQNHVGQTELLEHRVSWYPTGELGATLGQESSTTSALSALGKWHAPADAARCFGCHSTRVPQTNGQIHFDGLLPNVQCDRCHQNSSEHVEAMREGRPETSLVHWPALTSLESINRCGECHRRADELSRDELRPENMRLARFAPVGLSLSRCFQPGANQPADHVDSLTCIRCHDPHQPARTDPNFYRQRCLECHAGSGGRKPCSVQPPTSLCTNCHMPKAPLNAWLKFTDHWIRVRKNPVD